MVDVFKPGAGVDPVLAQQLLSEGAERAQAIVRDSQGQASGVDMLLSIVPDNVVGAASNNASILALMFFALMFGVGIVVSKTTPGIEILRRGIEGLFEVSMTLIGRSEEQTSELQSLMRISYAVFCLKNKKTTQQISTNILN